MKEVILKFTYINMFVWNSWRCLTLLASVTLASSSTTVDNNITEPVLTRTSNPPKVSIDSKYFLEGETFYLNCSIGYLSNTAISLNWDIPNRNRNESTIIVLSNEHAVSDGNLFNNIAIVNATKEDSGLYTCKAKSHGDSPTRTATKIYLDRAFLIVNGKRSHNNTKYFEFPNNSRGSLAFNVDSYPKASYKFYKNNRPLADTAKYRISNISSTGLVTLAIRQTNIDDTANYTAVIENAYLNSELVFDVRILSAPIITFELAKGRKFEQNSIASLMCTAKGYPLPKMKWVFSNGQQEQIINETDQEVFSVYKVTSYIDWKTQYSGNISCIASNRINETTVTKEFLVYEITNGFGIQNRTETWFPENTDVALKCIASKYDYDNVTWTAGNNHDVSGLVKLSDNSLSHIATLKLAHISLTQAGIYTCVAYNNSASMKNESITVTVAASLPPNIMEPVTDQTVDVHSFQTVSLQCQAMGVPLPKIEWYKEDELISNTNTSKLEITENALNQSVVNSTLTLKVIQVEYQGKYDCRASSDGGVAVSRYTVNITDTSQNKVVYLSVIGVIFIILIILVLYLAWKIRKEKQFKKELAAIGLGNFEKGVPQSLNPDLGIDEQAELLPYDKKYEFPSEKLKLGKQLGAGAFGVVYKADARGIINAEETTIVAVKMVKKTAENMYIKALASELKIMVHLGKHINIVNLLGACTKNVGKRELIVIVEYCKFGNIHNYMQKHREVFIDQLSDNDEKHVGRVNRGFSCSSGTSGNNSEYFGSNNTQDTDNTMLNTANSNRSGRKDNKVLQVDVVKVSESGYVQPQWRSNYESDYSYGGCSPRPLCSRDLLCWAFQIARGMEYLASRKVLHGDLAARNILLADDNVVKICDFGLAKSIYNNDEYQKKENSPLPVKWLAIECMTDRIFSTQSDVWSFGIVLWELFSLAKTPYPNISAQYLLTWLAEGNRLHKPTYADDRLYNVMMQCWEQKPTSRPTFGQLQEILGSFLEDNVRNHYVDLNSIYMQMNVKKDGEDYLAKVSSPDYNNLVTPSPHDYVNDTTSFFPCTPTQLQHDDEGYLQMSPATNQTIYSSREPPNKFDFDTRKSSPRSSNQNTLGSELTPMLAPNNLPARSGSESDQEGNSSPYLNMCPRIEEEAGEVFEVKNNILNAKNIQNSAVTNPTYIAFEVDNEKKPKDITNNYVNVCKPNGLVK